MILAFDTYYFQDKAKTVCIAFSHWTDTEARHVFSEIQNNNEPYTPGEFYKRELPCILSLLSKIPMLDEVNTIVVDGFVYLDDRGKHGLGGHLYEALQKKVPVIGVAKRNFAMLEKNKHRLLRGSSSTPLFITSVGIDGDQATEFIKSMTGDYRIPKLLKLLDTLTRE